MNILEMKNVTKVFGSGDLAITAVNSVDLSLTKGEIVLIMGPSGSGKTTLLSMAGSILKPTSGAIKLCGTEITSLKENELPKIRRDHLGFIFQSFNLLSSLSALENVQYAGQLSGLKGMVSKKRAKGLLDSLNLGNRLNSIPALLSGGEKQRVAIARALMNDPDLILADEPTANLDSQHGHEVMQQLKSLAKKQNKSVLIVSHDNRIRDVADRTLWLEDGKFKEIGRMVADPVCQMSIEKSIYSYRHHQKTLYFCSNGCKQEFINSPQKFPTN